MIEGGNYRGHCCGHGLPDVVQDLHTLMITSGPCPSWYRSWVCRRKSATAQRDFASALAAMPTDNVSASMYSDASQCDYSSDDWRSVSSIGSRIARQIDDLAAVLGGLSVGDAEYRPAQDRLAAILAQRYTSLSGPDSDRDEAQRILDEASTCEDVTRGERQTIATVRSALATAAVRSAPRNRESRDDSATGLLELAGKSRQPSWGPQRVAGGRAGGRAAFLNSATIRRGTAAPPQAGRTTGGAAVVCERRARLGSSLSFCPRFCSAIAQTCRGCRCPLARLHPSSIRSDRGAAGVVRTKHRQRSWGADAYPPVRGCLE